MARLVDVPPAVGGAKVGRHMFETLLHFPVRFALAGAAIGTTLVGVGVAVFRRAAESPVGKAYVETVAMVPRF